MSDICYIGLAWASAVVRSTKPGNAKASKGRMNSDVQTSTLSVFNKVGIGRSIGRHRIFGHAT